MYQNFKKSPLKKIDFRLIDLVHKKCTFHRQFVPFVCRALLYIQQGSFKL